MPPPPRKTTRPPPARSEVPDPADQGPLLGALLRIAHQEVIATVRRGLADAGYEDLQPAHFAFTQLLWDYPDGARQTELADAAGITKQSIGATLDQLEALGYVERVEDPSDKRARVVRFTKRGWKAARKARELVRGVERTWASRIGAQRLSAVRDALRELVATFAT